MHKPDNHFDEKRKIFFTINKRNARTVLFPVWSKYSAEG